MDGAADCNLSLGDPQLAWRGRVTLLPFLRANSPKAKVHTRRPPCEEFRKATM